MPAEVTHLSASASVSHATWDPTHSSEELRNQAAHEEEGTVREVDAIAWEETEARLLNFK